MKALFDLLQHPSLAYLEFQAPYLGLSDLWAHVTLGNRNGRALLSFEERASVAKLCELSPDFWHESLKVTWTLRPAPALQDACYIQLDSGHGEMGGEEYEYINARFMVWYRGACTSLAPSLEGRLSTFDYGNQQERFERERAELLATVADYIARWEELEARGRAIIDAEKAPKLKANKLTPTKRPTKKGKAK